MCLVKKIVNNFLDFYSRYSEKLVSGDDKPISYYLTNGDCGTMALAVGWVLEQKGVVGVEYCDTGDHSFLKVGDVYFDAVHSTGTVDPTQISTVVDNGFEVISRELLHQEYMVQDHVGMNWINMFALEQGVEPYPQLSRAVATLDKDRIKSILTSHGYEEKVQPNGVTDLNPYVYNATIELLAEYELLRDTVIDPTVNNSPPVADLALLNLNPYAYDNDYKSLGDILTRTRNPWLETVALDPPAKLIAASGNVEEDSPLIEAILKNEMVEITYGDMFTGGSKAVAFRIFYIENSEELTTIVSNLPAQADQIFCESVLDLVSEDEVHVVDGGHLYTTSKITTNNPVYYTDGEFSTIDFEEHGVGSLEMECQRQLCELVENINQVHVGVYKGRVNVEWVVKQPFYVLQNTLGYLIESLAELPMMQENLK